MDNKLVGQNIRKYRRCGAKKYLHSELGRNLVIAQKSPHTANGAGASRLEIILIGEVLKKRLCILGV